MRHDPILSRLREAVPTISVGVLAADIMSLGTEVELLEKEGVRLLHIDVMDGCFVPKLSVGPLVIKAIKTTLLKDVHLMIRDPVERVSEYVAAGADIIVSGSAVFAGKGVADNVRSMFEAIRGAERINGQV